jgi:hypothetical protein
MQLNVLKLPETSTLVPKYVGVLVLVINCFVLSASVGGCADCKNTHRADSIKFAIAQRPKAVLNFKNKKEKLYKTNLAMWFYNICEIERRTPK